MSQPRNGPKTGQNIGDWRQAGGTATFKQRKDKLIMKHEY